MATVQIGSLDWALTHVEQFGDTDVFPLPFEYAAIRHDWARIGPELARQDLFQWNVRPHRRLLAPKARHGFRIVTQLDPLDFLLFTALVYEMGVHLEATRLPIGEDTIFSFRFDPRPDGQLYNPNIGYADFQRVSREIIDDDGALTHVLITDIADFYPRIYTHRLENALHATDSPPNHIRALMRMLNGWNTSESYGVPVGTAAARLLAEVTISDVDAALIANNVRFVRFNDDYRMFANSYGEAYRHLAVLADVLFRNHGLTLQPQKTFILPTVEFVERYVRSYEEREVHSLRQEFDHIVNELGLGNPYEPIRYDNLNPVIQQRINQLNLAALFRAELQHGGSVDFSLIKFVLRRLAQLGDSSIADEVLDNIEQLHPAFPDIIQYLRSLSTLCPADKHRIGERLLDLLASPVIASIEYHKMWALDLFTADTAWDNQRRFLGILGGSPDQASRRKLILALGRSNQRHWFQSRWRDLFDEAPWSRRALIAAASCLSADARSHWYRAIRPRIDTLERAVAEWAEANPFH
jgi:hypothetical protein